MRFRPCIDIHNGKVKQIVGGSLQDVGNQAKENFVSTMDASDYAKLYQSYGLTGGHAILLNPKDSEFYESDLAQAKRAFAAFPGGLQIGGGITSDNALSFLDMGASHIIVTSYVFSGGKIHYERLKQLCDLVGKDHLVLDLSCRCKDGKYYIVTDRWQKFTEEILDSELMNQLSEFCAEFLVHGVNVEGTGNGLDVELLKILADGPQLPITYAGGIGSYEDLDLLRQIGNNRLDYTIGSALDLFGGSLSFEKITEDYND